MFSAMNPTMNHGVGEMQSSAKQLLHDHCHSLGTRLDSGVCDSFQSNCTSLGSTGSQATSLTSESDQTSLTDEPKLLSSDSGFGSLDKVPSLHRQLQALHIAEPLIEEPNIITLAQLKARTKAQKLADLESYDFNSSEEIPAKDQTVSENRCDSGLCESLRCSSLTEEEERPPHFEQDKDGDTFLHLMIVHEQASHAVKVIDSCPSWSLLNIQNDLGQTALHLAVLTNQPELVRKLLVHGAALDIRDRHGNTPLHLACKQGAEECAIKLTRRVQHHETLRVCYPVPFQRIPQPADLQNYDGHTCLQLAALGGHYSIMKHLVIECRADINGADWKSGRTLLHIAAETNDVAMAEFLLSHPRIKVEARTYEGHTPLRLALGRRHTNIVQLLILAGANMEEEEDDEDSAHGSSAEEEENMNCSSDSDIDDGFDDMEYQGQAVFPR